MVGEVDIGTQVTNYYFKDKTREHLEPFECHRKANGYSPGKVGARHELQK